ncbi:MAG: TldD/PmbA family protein [Candidatus Latescibacteria bacterium]|nr:TldD/PmbA family protein [Candidatus Latescibacterota bacterium]
MPDELLQQSARAVDLALQSGAGDAVASVSRSQSARFVHRDGRIEQVQQSTSYGLYLRLYVDGRYSTHSTTDLRPEQVRRFVEDAILLTRHLQPDPHRVIPDPALYADRSTANLDLDDPAVRDLPRDLCLEWLRGMDAAAHGDPRVISATSQVSFGSSASGTVSSNGFEGSQGGVHVSYGSSVTLEEGDGRRPEAYRYVTARHLTDLPAPEIAAAEALRRALDRLGSCKAPSARTTLVVDPEAGGNLLGRIVGALGADAIQQNRSFLAGKKDQRIASPLLTLTDEPLLPRGQNSRPYDGEGISARPMRVIEQGVLRSYYVDTYYGRKLGWAPTTGGPSNLVFAPGAKNLAALVADAGEGFYVNAWLGGNADGATGDFSFGFHGHAIEGGRLGAPVSEMNITGNLLDLLNNLVAVGDDPNPWSGYRTPTLVFRDVEFSGR